MSENESQTRSEGRNPCGACVLYLCSALGAFLACLADLMMNEHAATTLKLGGVLGKLGLEFMQDAPAFVLVFLMLLAAVLWVIQTEFFPGVVN